MRGVARALGVSAHVTSPTFTVVQTYMDGRIPIAHLDAYRLGEIDDEEAGLYLSAAEDALVLVEWPDALDDVFGVPTVDVRIAHLGGDERLLTLTVADPARETPLREAIARSHRA